MTIVRQNKSRYDNCTAELRAGMTTALQNKSMCAIVLQNKGRCNKCIAQQEQV
jgi:hypothetical protein